MKGQVSTFYVLARTQALVTLKDCLIVNKDARSSIAFLDMLLKLFQMTHYSYSF